MNVSFKWASNAASLTLYLFTWSSYFPTPLSDYFTLSPFFFKPPTTFPLFELSNKLASYFTVK